MSETLVLGLFGSSVVVAIVGIISNVLTFKMNRKATIEDRNESKNDKVKELEDRVESIEKKVDKQSDELAELIKKLSETVDNVREGQKMVLYDRILYLSGEYLKSNHITYNEKKNLNMMHSIYHNKLGGNGDLDDRMEDVDKIPVDYN